jgi:hypothetical protein
VKADATPFNRRLQRDSVEVEVGRHGGLRKEGGDIRSIPHRHRLGKASTRIG